MTIIKFNKSSINLIENFEKGFNCNSNNWDTKFESYNVADIVEKGHEILKSNNFLNTYISLIETVEELIGEELICQKRPTFRLQRKGKKSVDFHTDEILSGHPPNMINIWIPLSKTLESNSIWIVDEENTKKLISKFKNNNWDLKTLNKESIKVAKPQIMKYGEILTFNNKNLHGTIPSQENSVRYSIDFRLLAKKEINNMGNKKYGLDYIDVDQLKQKNITKSKTPGISVLYSNHKAKLYTHQVQRAMVAEFASANSIEIEREVAEWQVNHYPQINALIEEHPNHQIVFATKQSFEENSYKFRELCEKLKEHKSKVFFALERELLK